MTAQGTTEGIAEQQYCIVSTGQSGSSLLANILARAGADFKLRIKEDWDPVKGDMEHPLSHDAYADLVKVYKIDRSIIPNKPFKKIFEKRLNKKIDALKGVPYIKSATLVHLVPHLAKRAGKLKVIVLYRDFYSFAKSLHKKYGRDFLELKQMYLNTYNTALSQLWSFGGTAIEFNELGDDREEDWADVLSKLTSIPSDSLLEVRNDLNKKTQKDEFIFHHDKEIATLEKALREVKNRLIEPAKK